MSEWWQPPHSDGGKTVLGVLFLCFVICIILFTSSNTPDAKVPTRSSGVLPSSRSLISDIDRSINPNHSTTTHVSYSSNNVTATPRPKLTSTPRPNATAKPTATKTISYVGNKNTKKFHVSTCSSVVQMKNSNRVEDHDRDWYIDHGYKRCQRCYP